MSSAPPLPTAGGQPRKPASQRIPIIAEPFVGDRAKKALDIVSPRCASPARTSFEHDESCHDLYLSA